MDVVFRELAVIEDDSNISIRVVSRLGIMLAHEIPPHSIPVKTHIKSVIFNALEIPPRSIGTHQKCDFQYGRGLLPSMCIFNHAPARGERRLEMI